MIVNPVGSPCTDSTSTDMGSKEDVDVADPWPNFTSDISSETRDALSQCPAILRPIAFARFPFSADIRWKHRTHLTKTATLDSQFANHITIIGFLHARRNIAAQLMAHFSSRDSLLRG